VRFVVARCGTSKDNEAAKLIGVSASTVKRWKFEGAPINQAMDLMVQDGVATALYLRRRNLAKAMAIKIKGLESGDDRLRQNVATEIIEWELGKATQRNENNDKITADIYMSWGNDNISPKPTSGPSGGDTE